MDVSYTHCCQKDEINWLRLRVSLRKYLSLIPGSAREKKKTHAHSRSTSYLCPSHVHTTYTNVQLAAEIACHWNHELCPNFHTYKKCHEQQYLKL